MEIVMSSPCCASDSCHDHHDLKGKKLTPVTVLCGLEGAGKTTTIALLLKQLQEENVTVILNDMNKKKGKVSSMSLNEAKHQFMELPKGCLCCTLFEDFIESLFRTKKTSSRVIVEATGSAEVQAIGEVISFGDSDSRGLPLSDRFVLDSIVVLVDASKFFDNLTTMDYLQDRGVATEDDDFRNIPSVLVEQIEHADVILLTKTEVVDPVAVQQSRDLIKILNPSAKLVEFSGENFKASELLDLDLFDFKHNQIKPGWLKEIRGELDVKLPEDSKVSHFVFRERRPFHPGRAWDLIDRSQDLLPGVVRSRGFAWLATRNDISAEWTSAGNLFSMTGESNWFATTPRETWPTEDQKFTQDFVEPYGDRRQEIVIIGVNMDQEKIKNELERCLLTDEEMQLGPEGWKSFDDKFDPWVDVRAEDDSADEEEDEEEDDAEDDE